MDLAFLTPLYDRPGPWASVYVDTSRYCGSTAEDQSLEALGVQRALAAAGADEATCHAARMAVDELRHAREPVGRAFFAAAGEVVLDPPLSAPPPGTSAHWAPVPHTAPLLDLAADNPVCLVAYLDRRGADFEVRSSLGESAAGTVSVRRAGSDGPPAQDAWGTWDRWGTWEREAGEIVRALVVRQAEIRADLVVLVGDEPECAVVRDRLPGVLDGRVVRARHGAGSRLLDAELERIRTGHAALRAARGEELFASARGQDDAAVEGVPALVEAAREHRIAELLVRPGGPDAHREVWVGDAPDQVAVRRGDAAALGVAEPVPARADDALLRCAAASGASALSVTSAGPSGGLGALLRRSAG
ncbi:hypothetical protein ACIBL6_24900 [Streptomyces sp. NPDC050400]|uniref:baeRF2 domain-containing protein n=1 Tax=Streptomyces sp. NPDC050400 TaxID=3365610 RepID=UPI0037A8F02B